MIHLRNSYFKVTDSVKETISRDYTDHRSSSFMKYMRDLERFFCETFNTKYCTFFQGSGTLANEVMIEEIAKVHMLDTGIILNHGEFGARLVDTATQKGLNFFELNNNYDELYETLSNIVKYKEVWWILFPLCESSNGVVYDLEKILSIIESDTDVYIDGMSFVGNEPIDLSRVSLFTASSGKGLGSLPGIAIILHNKYTEERSQVKYIDLGYYRSKDGVPFTISTSQIRALGVSARERLHEANYKRVRELREYIEKRVFSSKVLSMEYPEQKHLAFFSFIVLPNSERLGEYLESKDIYLSFRTPYLIKKNCIEISLLDYHLSVKDLELFFNIVESYE